MLAVLAWTLLALILIDLVCGLVTHQPRNPRSQGNQLQVYFNYGTSIEAKLRRLAGTAPGQEAPILTAGWLSGDCASKRIDLDPKGVSIYGMSFSNRIADHLATLDPSLHIARFAGPGAPPSHSYACFLHRSEAGIDGNRIQIFGILASSLRRMDSISGSSTSFEQPQPFTFPRFSMRGGKLVRTDPAIDDMAGLRRILSDHAAWTAYVDGLAGTDRFASRLLFNHNVIDVSVTLRLLRRAWGQRHLNDLTDTMRGHDGLFSGDPELMTSLRGMLVDFARRSRAHGQRPIVFLFEDRGYDQVLRKTLVPMLKANAIPYILSADIAPATDAGIFEDSGHFLPSIDRKLAEEALPIIDDSANVR